MPLSPNVRVEFFFNPLGRGNLRLVQDEKTLLFIPSRTGSVGTDGKLKNAIPVARRYICDGILDPVESEKDLMFVLGKPGRPWKQRWYPMPVPQGHEKIDGILAHPDGSKNHIKDGNGSEGCCITQDNAVEWVEWQEEYWSHEDALIIPVEIGILV